MEHSADVHVELVELVNGLRRAHVPQHAIIQDQVVGRVEGGAVPLVVVGQVGVVQGQRLLPRLDVIDLPKRESGQNQRLLSGWVRREPLCILC